MSKDILLAVDAAPGDDPARHVSAASAMARELAQGTGDHVIVLHVHEYAVGRFGRLQVDCSDGEGEGVVNAVVANLTAHGVSAGAEIRKRISGTSPPRSWRQRNTTMHA